LRVPAFDSICHLLLDGREEPRALGQNIIIVGVDDWDGFIQKEAVDSFLGHMGGIIAENWSHLDVKVTHHGIAVPPTHHMYVG
jgi:hypothetical protein